MARFMCQLDNNMKKSMQVVNLRNNGIAFTDRCQHYLVENWDSSAFNLKDAMMPIKHEYIQVHPGANSPSTQSS